MTEAVREGIDSLDGAALREMFSAGAAALEANVEAINALNVFPVPDGDTGSNMMLSARAALEEAARSPQPSASEAAEALAKGALMGARGNSGVFLSQILSGFSRSVHGKQRLDAMDVSEALQQSSTAAYRAVSNPVEGTILTVIREVAEAARSTAPGDSLASVMERASATAEAAVARTPLLLQVLRDNGVVDAGGQGLRVMLEGMSRYVAGEADTSVRLELPASRPLEMARAGTHGPEEGYGFCTEFFIGESAVALEELRGRLESMGRSVLVVGEPALIKVHLHAADPAPILDFAGTVGEVSGVKIEDMDAQHQEFAAAGDVTPLGDAGVVAVVAGAGMASLFRSLGAAAVVPGGQSMNPSAAEIAGAVVSLACDHVIVLPNNKNVVATAEQAVGIVAEKQVHVVRSADMAQGVSAMMAFNFEAEPDANVSSMREAVSSVKTGLVTRAVRDALLEGVAVREGQAIGLTAAGLVVAEDDLTPALELLLDRLGVEDGSVVTLYYGADVALEESEATRRRLQERFPDAEVDSFDGGQPHYHYIVGVE